MTLLRARKPSQIVQFRNAVLLSGALLLAAFSLILLGPNERFRLVLTDILNPLVNLLAVGALFTAARQSSQYSPRLGAAWRILALAQLSYAIGDLIWGILEVGLNQQPFPSIADGFYLAFYGLFLLGVLTMPGAKLSRVEWVKRILDISIVMLAATLGFWNFLIGPLLASGLSENWFAQALTLAYPVGDLVLFWAFLVLLYGQTTQQNRQAIYFLAGAILVMIVSDSVFSYETLMETYNSGTFLDVSWIAVYLLIALAGIYQAMTVGPHESTEPASNPPQPAGNWLAYFPHAWILGAYLLLLHSHYVELPMNTDYLYFGVGAIIAFVLARQIVALRENAVLFQMLHQALEKVQHQALMLTAANQELSAEISERERVERQLSHDATHDALTGLPNRTLFFDRLGRAIEYTHRRADYPFSVLFLDLDHFKVINDSLGHPCGDEMLKSVANRLTVCLRSSDTVARLGGDEFAILLEDTRSQEAVKAAANRILGDMKLPFNLGGRQVFISASMGIVPSVQGYTQPDEVVRDADLAMYRAKSLGKDRCEIFDTDLRIQARSRLELEHDLRRAIENQELCLHYQPILSLGDNQIIGFEALLRWNHPERGLLQPSEFILIAEETGLIIPIGNWVLQQACRQIKQWQEMSPQYRSLHINVNLSGKQLSSPDFLEEVQHILLVTHLRPESLMLEITETVLIDQGDLASAIFTRLNELGVQFQIDDFGTGYSSLSYLRHFPIQTIKIDKTFIKEIGLSDKDTHLVRTILSMAEDLGMEAIAEGVETENQLQQLQQFGCRFAQGYLLFHPLEPSQAESLLQQPDHST